MNVSMLAALQEYPCMRAVPDPRECLGVSLGGCGRRWIDSTPQACLASVTHGVWLFLHPLHSPGSRMQCLWGEDLTPRLRILAF